MRILVVSDLHGDLASVRRAFDRLNPDLILCCGDWGDAHEVAEVDLVPLISAVRVHTTFGNHDPLELLPRLRNRDGSPVLIPSGECVDVEGLRIAAIGGIWAKSHKRPYYVTDADVDEASARIVARRPIDVLLTHACPVGLADLTPTGRHGGQRCFLRAFRSIAPRLYLCGHLHVAQEKTLKGGSRVINVGATIDGSVVVIEYEPRTRSLDARLVVVPVADQP